MPRRREVVLGGLVTIIWGTASCNCSAQARRVRTGTGCMLQPDEAEQFLETATEQQSYITGREPIIASSGDRDFDYALAHTLSRLTDSFRVLPGFAYYDDYEGENAYATTARRLSRSDGSVLFGQRLLKTLMAEPEHPEVGVTAVCAHEFAHILQFKLNLFRRLDAGQRTTKRSELHADYLAGFYAGLRKLEKSDYPAAVFATTKFASGDFDIHNRDHHGTPEERAAAVVRGFEVSHRERRNLNDAIQIGINYVSRL